MSLRMARVKAGLKIPAPPSGYASPLNWFRGYTSRLTASLSAARKPRAPDRVADRALGADRERDPVRDVQVGVPRACCTIRITSRAMPSAANSGVTLVSSATRPVPPCSAEAEPGSVATDHYSSTTKIHKSVLPDHCPGKRDLSRRATHRPMTDDLPRRQRPELG